MWVRGYSPGSGSMGIFREQIDGCWIGAGNSNSFMAKRKDERLESPCIQADAVAHWDVFFLANVLHDSEYQSNAI